ncbi:MAG TPA: pirin family protein [Polyangiaceae bacterium]|nr:pirin family protein [Polyangiaceae bacterium]
MSSPPESVLEIRALAGPPWQTSDPFLFCVHHDDAYPAGNERLGPAASLAGRNMGQDFAGKDGWRMYHGEVVPGFPQHPHRGFETVTIIRRGLIDHSDSLGASARFGPGDVQWLTAGGGIVHSEMFPLLDRAAPNPLELFQIWLNLPAEDKLVEPHFAMLWSEDIPRRVVTDMVTDGAGGASRTTEVTLIAGALEGQRPPSPPPHSWASRPDSDIAIWTVRMDAGASWVLPPAAHPSTVRTLYFFRGPSLRVGGRKLDSHAAAVLRSDVETRIEAGAGPCDALLLQGRPIGQPVVQYGPFVMNSPAEIQRAVRDYQRTGFGGWPWPTDDPVHAASEGRFAKHADGRVERAPR